MRKAVGTSLGLICTVGLVWWLSRNTDWSAVQGAILRLSPWGMGLSLMLLWVSLPLRAWQWQGLMVGVEKPGLKSVFKAVCVGHLGNLVLPFRGGEAVKTLHLSRNSTMPIESLLSSLLIVRLQDLLPIGLMVLLSFFLLGSMTGSEDAIILDSSGLLIGLGLTVGIAIIGLVSLWLITRYWEWVVRSLHPFQRFFQPKWYEWGIARLDAIHEGLQGLRSTRAFFQTQAYSLGCWLLFWCATIPVLIGAGIAPMEAPYIAFVVTGLSTLVQVLPPAPSGIGTYHAACITALSWSAPYLPSEDAIAIAITLHLLGSLGIGLPGVGVVSLDLLRATHRHRERY